MLSKEEIAKRLKKDRNLQTVSENTGLSYPTVYNFANEKIDNPNYQTLKTLSDYLEENL